MVMGISTIILKRSVGLSKTYLVISGFLVIMAVGLSALSYLVPPTSGQADAVDVQILLSVLFNILFTS